HGQIWEAVAVKVGDNALVGKVGANWQSGTDVHKLAVPFAQNDRDSVGIEVGGDVIGLAIVIEISGGQRRHCAAGGFGGCRAEVADAIPEENANGTQIAVRHEQVIVPISIEVGDRK